MSGFGVNAIDMRGWVRGLVDLLLPPQCLSCGAEVERTGALCAACWDRVSFVSAPFCACCGLPFEYDLGPGALCGACARKAPPFDRARAVFLYDEASRDMVLRFKHADRTSAAPAFGRWLARAGAELLTPGAVLVPVPIHWTRLFARRYNQAALLAHALGRESGLAVEVSALERIRRTASQGRMNPRQRRDNLRGAFVASSRVEGARVILIDDVMTTGATVRACARVLRAAGAASVDVLTLARAVRGDPA